MSWVWRWCSAWPVYDVSVPTHPLPPPPPRLEREWVYTQDGDESWYTGVKPRGKDHTRRLLCVHEDQLNILARDIVLDDGGRIPTDVVKRADDRISGWDSTNGPPPTTGDARERWDARFLPELGALQVDCLMQ